MVALTKMLIKSAIMAVLCAGLVACSEKPAEAPRAAQPNIILISAGDMSPADLSIYGGPFNTPNLDRLAQLGTVFDKAYSAAGQVGPARAGLITGRYPQRFGYIYDTGPVRETIRNNIGMPETELILPERLKNFGYRTLLIGSWQLGAARPYYPMRRGFDYYWGTLGGSSSYATPLRDDLYFARTSDYALAPARSRYDLIFRGRDGEVLRQNSEYLTDSTGREAVAQLRELLAASDGVGSQNQVQNREQTGNAIVRQQPFFMWLSFHAPRQPLTALQSDVDAVGTQGSRNRTAYAGMVRALDRNIGRVLDILDVRGALDDTVIAFIADRGCDARAQTCPCGSLRGGAPSLREGALRVPMIMAMPARFLKGQRSTVPTISMDITATLLELADPSDRLIPDLDGASLVPVLANGSTGLNGRILFWQQYPFSAALQNNVKMLFEDARDIPQIYNLDADPLEGADVARNDLFITNDLETKYDLWQQRNEEPLWIRDDIERVQVCDREEMLLQ